MKGFFIVGCILFCISIIKTIYDISDLSDEPISKETVRINWVLIIGSLLLIGYNYPLN